MPHISVKMWPGRSEEQKQKMVDRIVEAVKETTGSTDDYVTVSVEDIPSSVWPKEVFKPEILDKADKLYKKPGYGYSEAELEG